MRLLTAILLVGLLFATTITTAQSDPTPTPNIPPVQQTLTAIPQLAATSTPAPPEALPAALAVITPDNAAAIEELRVLPGHIGGAWNVTFSPDGTLLASAGRDHAVRLWDVETGELVREFLDHTTWVIGVDFSPDGRWLVTGESGSSADDRFTVQARMQLWDVETGELLRVYEGHTGGIWSVDFSPDGQMLVSAGLKAACGCGM